MQPSLNGQRHMSEIHFDNNPPAPGPALFIKRLKGGEDIVVCVLANEIKGIWAHWSGKKSEPHFFDSAHCPGCQAQRPKRWKGYLHVYDYAGNKELILEVTPASAVQINRLCACSSKLRGERIRLQRSKGDNGRLTVSVLAVEPKIDALPKEKDPRPSILKLWGISQEDPEGWMDGSSDQEGTDRFKL